jgi:hypothetical protein
MDKVYIGSINLFRKILSNVYLHPNEKYTTPYFIIETEGRDYICIQLITNKFFGKGYSFTKYQRKVVYRFLKRKRSDGLTNWQYMIEQSNTNFTKASRMPDYKTRIYNHNQSKGISIQYFSYDDTAEYHSEYNDFGRFKIDKLGICFIRVYYNEGYVIPHFHIMNNSGLDVSIKFSKNEYYKNPSYKFNKKQRIDLDNGLNSLFDPYWDKPELRDLISFIKISVWKAAYLNYNSIGKNLVLRYISNKPNYKEIKL